MEILTFNWLYIQTGNEVKMNKKNYLILQKKPSIFGYKIVTIKLNEL